jgi:hypothetical protein
VTPMKIKIFQISQDRDKDRVKFLSLQEMQNFQRSQGESALINPRIYDEVFSGEVDCRDLESVYTLFNTNHPPFFRGTSLSMSDIVQTEDGFHYCDRFGFENIRFDPSQTHKPDNLLRVVGIEPGKPACEAEIADSLRAFQQAVGGNMEVFCPFEDNAVIVCNEEGKIDGLPPNRTVHGEPMVGNLVIVGDNGEGEFCSLTDEQTQKYLAAFQLPELSGDESEDMDSGMKMF